jgi:hypothetical protein
VLRQRLGARPCGLLVGADCNVKNVLDIFLRDLVLAMAFYNEAQLFSDNEAQLFSAGPETRLTFDAFHEQGRRLNLLPSVGLDADESLFVERTSTFRSRSRTRRCNGACATSTSLHNTTRRSHDTIAFRDARGGAM